MQHNKFTTAIFDLDGTMMYTLDDIALSINIMLRHFGYPTHDPEKVKTFINNGAYMLIKRALPDEHKENHQKVLEAVDYYNKVYEQNIAVNTKPYDGIVELITQLKNKNITLAVASNKPQTHTRILCEKFFNSTFAYVYGPGDGRPEKPNKEAMNIVLNAINKKPEEILYIGDSVVDVQTAKNAGMFCCGVLWGFKGENSFVDLAPDVTVKKPSEILNFFN